MKFVRHKVKFVRHKVKFVRHKVKLRGRSHSKLEIKRNPMISVGFARVSKKRPCRICGKPSYCGFSRDGRYFHMHAHQCGISRAIRQWWKYTRPHRNSLHDNSTKNHKTH